MAEKPTEGGPKKERKKRVHSKRNISSLGSNESGIVRTKIQEKAVRAQARKIATRQRNSGN
jgi:hypothetical protein